MLMCIERKKLGSRHIKQTFNVINIRRGVRRPINIDFERASDY